MQKLYKVSGITCEGYSKTVSQKLEKVDRLNKAIVDLAKSQAKIKTDHGIPLEELKKALLPMTEVSIIENVIMLLMAGYMLINISLNFS